MQKRRLILSLMVPLVLVGLLTGFWLHVYQREQACHELILAIQAHDTARALSALHAHADPNSRDASDGMLSFRGYLARLARQLRGIKPSASNAGSTALALAVEKQNTVVAEALLDAGARDYGESVTSITANNATYFLPLLLAAAQQKNIPLVQALAKHGWNMNTVDRNRQTALFYTEDANMAKTLVTLGTHLNATNTSGHTALDSRVIYSNMQTIQILLDLGARDANALTVAIQYDNSKMVEKLLDLGWNGDAQDNLMEEPPLIQVLDVTEAGDTLDSDLALLLLRRGAHVNSLDKKGRTPLHVAATGGGEPEMNPDSLQLVMALLERGANVDAQSHDGMTPLMVATLHLRPVLMQTLLQHGAKVNLRRHSGETALTLARQNSSPNSHDKRHAIVVQILKAAGATL
jgi:ankyrin repeat protein